MVIRWLYPSHRVGFAITFQYIAIMKIAVLRSALATVLIGSMVTVPNSAAALPSPFEQELKAATQVTLGKPISMAVPKCKLVKVGSKFTTKCTYEKFVVTVNSFAFNDIRTPIGVEEASFNIDVKIENFSSRDTGIDVGKLLRCKKSRSGSPFYSDGIDPQSIPPRSEDAGIIVSSFPDEISLDKCEMPTLWISLTNSEVNPKDKKMMAEIKKRKLVANAYIPLTPAMLSKR
jgi:hypothetical protein